MTATLEAKETLHQISFALGIWYANLSDESKNTLAEHVDGMNGLMAKAIELGDEFDRIFVGHAPDRFVEMIDNFTNHSIEKLTAELMAERMTG